MNISHWGDDPPEKKLADRMKREYGWDGHVSVVEKVMELAGYPVSTEVDRSRRLYLVPVQLPEDLSFRQKLWRIETGLTESDLLNMAQKIVDSDFGDALEILDELDALNIYQHDWDYIYDPANPADKREIEPLNLRGGSSVVDISKTINESDS